MEEWGLKTVVGKGGRVVGRVGNAGFGKDGIWEVGNGGRVVAN